MTQLTPTDNLLEETHTLLSMGRKIALKVAENIWKLRNSLYPEKNQHLDFVKFCADEFGLKQSAVSKYESIGDGFYAHGLTADSFKVDDEYRDYEVVYYASKLPMSVDRRLSTALTLTRIETKQTKAEYDNHEPVFKQLCVVGDCYLTPEQHPVPVSKENHG